MWGLENHSAYDEQVWLQMIGCVRLERTVNYD